MARITLSTTGANRQGRECHDIEDVDYVRFMGDSDRRQVVNVVLTTDQALAVAYDLLYQAVDAGAISGWNVQFPEQDYHAKAEEAVADAMFGPQDVRQVFEDVREEIRREA